MRARRRVVPFSPGVPGDAISVKPNFRPSKRPKRAGSPAISWMPKSIIGDHMIQDIEIT